MDSTGNNYRGLAIGDLFSAGAVRFSSDINLKNDVRTIENPIADLEKIRGVSWEWKDPSRGEGRHMGVIAQEVEQVYPNLVSIGPDGNKSVAYSELTGVLIEAFKAQQKEIRELRAEVEALRA